ncbi:mannonate dehydratase [Cerasicoccus fimbriatus]|uniref:mannonate dehydratase n=1 Tax=Cerasicoccus fimbriatus TaxID=3014554 RepID=UPI0022B388FC|nr:mannonate dehydratase [Cerasicoccus sp. TK19100]
MKFSLLLSALPNDSWTLARQIGVTHAVTKAAPQLTGLPAPDDLSSLRAISDSFAQHGIKLAGLEGDQFDMSRIKRGEPGRDEDIERYQKMLRNMGEVGIPLLCYNFMPRAKNAEHDWHRTDCRVPLRGGSLSTAFDLKELPPSSDLEFSQEDLWENYRYFIQAVIPTAEEVGVKMALHPDDPPLPSLGSVPRIFNHPEAWMRAFDLAPSASSGVTFCQANFLLMGVDIEYWARFFAEIGKLFFVHIRDVEGVSEKFTEVWHDEGPTDLSAMLKLYHELGFSDLIRDDHVPSMLGEQPDMPGYGMLGHLYTVGYLKGLLKAQKIPYA